MIGIIALIAVFVAAYFAFKTANDNGRSGPLWALATLGVGLGFQIIMPILIGIVLAIIYMSMGTPVDMVPAEIGGLVTIIWICHVVYEFRRNMVDFAACCEIARR